MCGIYKAYKFHCHNCHTDHWTHPGDSFDGLCPHCEGELPDALIKEIEEYLALFEE